jgi:WD40 repeat protein
MRAGVAVVLCAAVISADVSSSGRPFAADRLGLVKCLSPHSNRILAIAFTADGSRLITAGADDRIQVLRAGSWSVERTILRRVHCLAPSPCGRFFACVDSGGAVALVDVRTGREARALARSGAHLLGIEYSRDGRVGGVDGEGFLWVWDAETGRRLLHAGGFSSLSPSIVFLREAGRFLAVREGGVLCVCGPDARAERQLEAMPEPIDFALEADGRTLLSASADGKIRVTDLPSRRLLRSIGAESLDHLPVLALAGDGKSVIGTTGSVIEVYDHRSGSGRASLSYHTEAVAQIAVTADRRYVATLGTDTLITIWGYRARMNGVPSKGFLGVIMEDDAGYCRVDSVIGGTAADKAGLRAGDRLRKVNGVEIENSSQAIGTIGLNPVGTEVQVEVEREGRILRFRAVLGVRPRE